MTAVHRLLVLGAEGLLGTALTAVAGADPRVGAVVAAGRDRADVFSQGEVERLLQDERPDAVVNAAAFTSADGCEQDPGRAYEVNTLGARRTAHACTALGARCVYVSTDFVFDGAVPGPYDEHAPTGPVLTYGMSKLAGESETLRAGPGHLVVRTAALFGPRPRSPRARPGFVDRVLDRAAHGESARVVDTVVMSPTYTVDLARMIVELLAGEAEEGVYHLTNEGSASWFELAHAAVSTAGLAARPRPSDTAGAHATAPRPPSTPLTSVRLPDRVRRLNRPWRDALAEHLA